MKRGFVRVEIPADKSFGERLTFNRSRRRNAEEFSSRPFFFIIISFYFTDSLNVYTTAALGKSTYQRRHARSRETVHGDNIGSVVWVSGARADYDTIFILSILFRHFLVVHIRLI